MPSTPTDPVVIDERSRIAFHKLVVRREDDEYIVGRPGSSEFVALPELGVRAIGLLDEGLPFGSVRNMLDNECGTPVELAEFTKSLVALGFVSAVNGQPIDAGTTPPTSLPWLRPRHGRWLFGSCAKVCFAILVVSALVTLAARPRTLPNAHDFFWDGHPALVLVINGTIMCILIGLHEVAHLAAARSLGVPGRITLGTRLHLLVAQTDLTGLWAVERSQRYRCYLAGMACDLVLLAVVILARAYTPVLTGPLAAVALLLTAGIISQFQLYLRTDVYFALANVLCAKNLMEDAASWVVWALCRGAATVTHRREAPPHPLRLLRKRERLVVRSYAVLMLAGAGAALGVYVTVGVPIIAKLYVLAIGEILSGRSWDILDGAATLAIEGFVQVLFVRVLWRNRGKRTRAVLRRVVTSA